jgi:hypothetical protein
MVLQNYVKLFLRKPYEIQSNKVVMYLKKRESAGISLSVLTPVARLKKIEYKQF